VAGSGEHIGTDEATRASDEPFRCGARGKPCRRSGRRSEWRSAACARVRASVAPNPGRGAHGRADRDPTLLVEHDLVELAGSIRARALRTRAMKASPKSGPSLAIESAPGSSTVLVAIAASSWVSEARTASSFSFRVANDVQGGGAACGSQQEPRQDRPAVGQRRPCSARARTQRPAKRRAQDGSVWPRESRSVAKRELPSARNSIAAPKPTQVFLVIRPVETAGSSDRASNKASASRVGELGRRLDQH